MILETNTQILKEGGPDVFLVSLIQDRSSI